MNYPIPLLEEAFRWTLGSSIRVSVLIILVLLAQKFLARHLTSGLRYGLSILVLIGLLMPVAPPSVFSLANVFRTDSLASAYSRPIPSPGAAPQAPPQNILEGTPPSSTSNTSSSSAPTARPAKPQLSIPQTAAVIWVSGASVLLAVSAWRYRKWARLTKHGRLVTNQDLLALLEESKRAMGVRRAVALVEVDRLSSPAVFGVWRVRLLLPDLVIGKLSADELRMVFLHEMAHVRRGDVLLNWVLMLVQFLHWFNPLVWLALHRLRSDRELACDALVLQKIPRDQHVGYGHVLIKLIEAFCPERPVFASALPVVSSQQEIKTRLRMIRNHRQASRVMRSGTLLLAAALGCVALTRAREHKSEATPQPIVVRIDRTGALYLGSEKSPVTVERLKQVLHSAMVKAPDTRLAIHADKNAPFGQIVRVMDTAKEAKVGTVNAFTEGKDTTSLGRKSNQKTAGETGTEQIAAPIGGRSRNTSRIVTESTDERLQEPISILVDRNENLQELENRKLILTEFKQAGYSLPETVLDDLVSNKIRERFHDRATLAKMLQAEGMTFEKYRQQVREDFIIEQLRSNVFSTQRPRSVREAIESGATPLKSDGAETGTKRVEKIEIRQIGPQPVNDVLRSNITLKAGGLYDPKLVDTDVRHLYATGIFYNIQVTSAPGESGLIVTYIVQGRPQLADIRFTGNTKFSDADLLKNLSSKAGELFDERKAFRDQETIQTLYEKAGIKDVRVKYTYSLDAEAGRATVTFQITTQAAELARKLLATSLTSQQIKQIFQAYQAQSEQSVLKRTGAAASPQPP